MPILYTIPSDGPSLTLHLKRQWLDKHLKNRLRTRKLQVGPYARPERNSMSAECRADLRYGRHTVFSPHISPVVLIACLKVFAPR